MTALCFQWTSPVLRFDKSDRGSEGGIVVKEPASQLGLRSPHGAIWRVIHETDIERTLHPNQRRRTVKRLLFRFFV